MNQETIQTAGNDQLQARFFAPASPARAAVLIVPAMGVTQSYYGPLASWLAGQGFVVATFDYRGVGESLRGRLRDVEVDILAWAGVDCAAVLEALAARSRDLPLYWIGHSLGGQIVPFVPNRRHIDKIVTVACGSGYWRENAPALRWRVGVLWFLVAPLAMRTLGYFPGRALRMVGDLPRGVMEQWRRWCLDPAYAAGAEGPSARAGYAAVTTPIVSLSFTDDEFMSARNITALHELYTGAPRQMIRLAPREVGERRIGHFGFFRPRYEQSLWRPYLLPALA